MIEDSWLVLDIGSGHNPHPRANILADKFLGSTPHRMGEVIQRDRRPFVIADALMLPFKDRAFDYVFALHIAEHIESPERFCQELMRVGKRGFIETPSKLAEMLLREPVIHHWVVSNQDNVLVFQEAPVGKPLGVVGELFYALFYPESAGQRGRWALRFPHKLIERIVLFLITWMIHVPWVKLRRWTYTCFEWEDRFEYSITKKSEMVT